MSKILMIPVHLDALVLNREKQVVEAMADFSRLPYSKEGQDENPNQPNVSESILSRPFENLNLFLKPGVHLHWSLPDALTHGEHADNTSKFPQAPNRWLVMRYRKNFSSWVLQREWMVESDFVHPEGEGRQLGAISIPQKIGNGRNLPFRFLGRTLPIEAWLNRESNAEYLPELTALGYGEPTFAAFYPNSHSVFGFYDDEIEAENVSQYRYEVVGFYSDGSRDAFQDFIAGFRSRWTANNASEVPTGSETMDGIREEMQWEFPFTEGDSFASDTLYFARMDFAAANIQADQLNSTEVNVTIGNTGTESVSAFLGRRLGTDRESRRVIEEQFEAIALDHQLDHRQLDLGAKFMEALHTKGFSSQPAGTLWTIRPGGIRNAADSAAAEENQNASLPEHFSELLNRLNVMQADYDIQRHELDSLRKQLFSDWYKYMLSAYPPLDAPEDFPSTDEIKWFIEKKVLALVEEKSALTGVLVVESNADDMIRARTDQSEPRSLAFRLAMEINMLQQEVAVANVSLSEENAELSWVLQAATAPRYWQPNEPVLLLTGDAIRQTERHGQDGRLRPDGRLECYINETIDLPAAVSSNRQLIRDAIQSVAGSGPQIGFHNWTQQPWHPIILEWQISVLPSIHGTNQRPDAAGFKPGLLNENYTLGENEVDLKIKADRQGLIASANIYSGSTVLSPRTNLVVLQQIETFLEKELLPLYYAAHSVSEADQQNDYFAEHKATILDWYEQENCGTEANELFCRAIDAWRLLQQDEGATLSQALSGFNDALIMHKQTTQLEVADVLSFPEYEDFSNDMVMQAIADQLDHAPLPLNDFNPIRSGAFKIEKLRLIDTFGRYLDLETESAYASVPFRMDDDDEIFQLSPRIVQPARLNFRWLSALDDSQEMNVHPASSPVCGWLLANELDNSLMVFDADGQALGSVQKFTGWLAAPGDTSPVSVSEIGNAHLQKMVNHLLDQGPDFIGKFIDVFNSALANIDPEDFSRHQSRALLMSRPVALVRARINLEVKGLPSIHQGWNRLRQDLHRNSRDTDGFPQVEFPVRIGEFSQLNDGVLGYWLEDDDGYQDNLYYAVQSDPVAESLIVTRDEETIQFSHSIDSDPVFASMLLDPRGKVHLTSGILPTKSLEIPDDQYQAALRRIEVTFLSSPLLADADEVSIALPKEPGFSWSWLEKRNTNWTELPAEPDGESAFIQTPQTSARFSRNLSLRDGWLKLRKNSESEEQ